MTFFVEPTSVISLGTVDVARDDSGYFGYQSATYANSLSEHGALRYLPVCEGWVIVRTIPEVERYDAMGLYPLFCCRNWDSLTYDIQSLANDLVSICLVPDPFGNYTRASLCETFDFVRSYKDRYITELSRDPIKFVSTHHRKYAEKGLRELEIEVAERPEAYLDEWVSLYAHTCKKHKISGMAALSRDAFMLQLKTPGLVMFIAKRKGKVVAIHIWITQNGVGYGHLAGHHDDAYMFNASYALYWYALNWFQNKVEYLDLGGVAGAAPNETDGLSFFKKGWSTETRITLFCGKILNSDVYAELSKQREQGAADFFPAYRARCDI